MVCYDILLSFEGFQDVFNICRVSNKLSEFVLIFSLDQIFSLISQSEKSGRSRNSLSLAIILLERTSEEKREGARATMTLSAMNEGFLVIVARSYEGSDEESKNCIDTLNLFQSGRNTKIRPGVEVEELNIERLDNRTLSTILSNLKLTCHDSSAYFSSLAQVNSNIRELEGLGCNCGPVLSTVVSPRITAVAG